MPDTPHSHEVRQTLDPRLASSVRLLTGALPAEYGLVTGAVVDLQTKTGLFEPGGEVSIYGGSHGTIEPSFDYGGNSGAFNYFMSGDYLRDGLGIESPDGSATPLHDHTEQFQGFGMAVAHFQHVDALEESRQPIVGRDIRIGGKEIERLLHLAGLGQFHG